MTDHRGTVQVLIRRGDGLAVEQIIDGMLLSRMKWPEDAIRSNFERGLRQFMDAAEQVKEDPWNDEENRRLGAS